MSDYKDKLIFGKQAQENIVSVEIEDNYATLFLETEKGIEKKIVEQKFWLLSPKKLGDSLTRLSGDQYYKYIAEYDTRADFQKFRSLGKRHDCYSIWDEKNAFLTRYGYTYFKGLKLQDVSVLSFDIETSGLVKDKTSRVFTIANVYRKGNKIIRKLFSVDEFETDYEMLDSWMKWVVEVDPSILIGHNIFGYDFPYLRHCIEREGLSFDIGRDGRTLKFDNYTSKFRKDGSQEFEYTNVKVYGREIADTFFLSFKWDIKRELESNALKSIVKQLGLEKPGRTFIDASKISQQWKDLELRKKIKQYNIEDADDALKLFDIMAPAYFYLTQKVPMPFQAIVNKASGSMLNLIMVRSYLQINHSIAKASNVGYFEGAISYGRPGVYRNAIKWDVSALYPSIMRTFGVYDKQKDPNKHFITILNYFLDSRLKHKKLAKNTGDQYYNDMEQSEKIFANSAYGFLSAPGLNYNSPTNASFITEKGRELLKQSIKWSTSKEYEEWNKDV